ncbi:MAG: cellulose biosynthesis cyclic di-GMP-binding regulatory protein BcsB [Terrimicrobiaceae bacterium]|nr:cellulose biosynthesis cyclic di-GMP-binding regulatory protein BcsB [Terrimicrobiaceae bacterium]
MRNRGQNRSRIRWETALALGIALAPLPAIAQQPSGAPAAPGVAAPAAADRSLVNASTVRLPLRQLIGPKEPIYLMNAQSTYTLFMPLSARYGVRSCKLHLNFTNSIALLSERSTLRVVLNDKVIAQFFLTRNEPDHTVDIEIPVKYLEIGPNQFQFVVSQHYTLECEDPAAPELWTQILPDESYFEAVITWNRIYPKLSLLQDLIDRKLWEPYRYHVCFPNGASGGISPTQLSWGSIVAQGVGLNLEYRPLTVTTGGALLAGVDNIVVGQQNELTQYLTATEIGAINGSFIAIKALPGDPTHFLLVISGRSEEEVGQAAYAFSLINFPLPDSQYAQVDRINFPQKDFWVRNAPVKDPGVYSFRQLGLEKNASIHGWNTGSVQLQTYMPGDLSQDDPSNIELRLHFAYGAAFRQDSVLNMFVNREFQYAIRMDDLRGAVAYGYKVYLPVKAFQPGRNLVEISPTMVPIVTNHCEMVQNENLWFTLYRDSDFVVPGLQKKARLPSFTLFSQTAFPFTSAPDGTGLAVFVAAKDNPTICATWMLLAKMAQISGSVLFRAELNFTVPKSKKDLLIVGPLDSIPPEVLTTAPVNLQQLGRLRYVVQVSPSPEATAIGPVQEVLERLRGVPSERSEREQPATVEMATTADLLDDTVAVAYESPFARARGAMVITARDTATLYNGIVNLQDRRYWDNLNGNLAVWNTTPRSLATARLGPEFIYKVDNPIKRTQNSFNGNPIVFVAVVFLTIGLLAFVMRYLLRKREIKEE